MKMPTRKLFNFHGRETKFIFREKRQAFVSLARIDIISAAQKKKLADSAAKLLKNPRAVAERAALEIFIARELYGLSLDDWKHLTSTFTFGSGESKAELDEIIRQSVALWKA
jgi:hypothetical protein